MQVLEGSRIVARPRLRDVARDQARNPYCKGHEVARAIADWQQ